MNTSLNRRHFLRLAALAPLAAGTPSHALTAIPRTGGTSFTPPLNAYSILEQLNANITDADSLRLCVSPRSASCSTTPTNSSTSNELRSHPGHETYPIYKQGEPLHVVESAVRWLSMK